MAIMMITPRRPTIKRARKNMAKKLPDAAAAGGSEERKSCITGSLSPLSAFANIIMAHTIIESMIAPKAHRAAKRTIFDDFEDRAIYIITPNSITDRGIITNSIVNIIHTGGLVQGLLAFYRPI
jgi:hypothetical protein